MEKIRTTLRIEKNLKKRAEREALERDMTLQRLFNEALENYLRKTPPKRTKGIKFPKLNLKAPLNNLNRDFYYGDIDKYLN